MLELEVGNVWTYLHGSSAFGIIDSVTSYDIEGRWHSDRYKKAQWDGKKRFRKFDRKRGLYRIGTGFLEKICKALDARDYPYELIDERDFIPPDPVNQIGDFKIDEGKYDYQFEAVGAACLHGRGVIQAATGAGKSAMGAAVIKSFGLQTVWLTHRVALLHQTRKALQKLLGEPIGILGDSQRDIQNITVAMVQTIDVGKKNQEEVREFLATCEVVIGDECLTGDSLISTEIGPVPVVDIPTSGANYVLCFDEEHDQWVYRKILKWIRQGVKKTVNIRTNSSQIRCTRDHLVRTESGWREAGSLSAGDRILSPVLAVVGNQHSHQTVEADFVGSPKVTGCHARKLTGTRGGGNLKPWPRIVGAGAESDYKLGSVEYSPHQSTTVGQSSYLDMGPDDTSVNLSLQKKRGLSTEHCSGTLFSQLIKESTQTPDSCSIMEALKKRGPGSKHLDCQALESKLGVQRIEVGEIRYSQAQVPAPQDYEMSKAQSDALQLLPLLGLNEYLQKAGHGGIWTTEAVSEEVSVSTLRAEASKKSNSSQSIYVQCLDSIRAFQKVRGNTGSLGSESKTQSSGSGSHENTPLPEWSTSFQKVMSVVEGPPLGEPVFDLEVEQHHNFVANGLLVHNCHHLESRQWQDTFSKIGAAHRFGLTATPSFKGPGMGLIGMTGPVIFNIGPQELIRRGVLVPPRIWMIRHGAKRIKAGEKFPAVYAGGVVRCNERNDRIEQVALDLQDERKGCLTLVRQINHGNILVKRLRKIGIKVEFINSKVKQGTRDLWLEQMRTRELDHIVAVASIMGEGVDIPWLPALINATATKGGGSKETGSEHEVGRVTTQFLGRGLRCYPGKEYFEYFDFADTHHKFLAKAAKDRTNTLEEQGYSDQIKYWSER